MTLRFNYSPSSQEVPSIDWAAFSRDVRRGLTIVTETTDQTIALISAVWSPEPPEYQRRQARARRRSRRNTAGQRRRRKHGARR